MLKYYLFIRNYIRNNIDVDFCAIASAAEVIKFVNVFNAVCNDNYIRFTVAVEENTNTLHMQLYRDIKYYYE